MRTILAVLSMCFVVYAMPATAQEQDQQKERKTRESYSLGYDFGQNLRIREIDVDADVLLQAVREGLEGKKAALTTEEMRETLKQLQKEIRFAQEKRYSELAAKNREEGKALLEANREKQDVVTLPSGLQYRVIREGSGPSPEETDVVEVNYSGTLPNGVEFDNSYARGKPTTFRVNGVIKGWTEALQLMKTGSKWQVFVAPELAYGERKMGRIPPGSTLVFEIELVSIKEKSDSAIGSNAIDGEEAEDLTTAK